MESTGSGLEHWMCSVSPLTVLLQNYHLTVSEKKSFFWADLVEKSAEHRVNSTMRGLIFPILFFFPNRKLVLLVAKNVAPVLQLVWCRINATGVIHRRFTPQHAQKTNLGFFCLAHQNRVCSSGWGLRSWAFATMTWWRKEHKDSKHVCSNQPRDQKPKSFTPTAFG